MSENNDLPRVEDSPVISRHGSRSVTPRADGLASSDGVGALNGSVNGSLALNGSVSSASGSRRASATAATAAGSASLKASLELLPNISSGDAASSSSSSRRSSSVTLLNPAATGPHTPHGASSNNNNAGSNNIAAAATAAAAAPSPKAAHGGSYLSPAQSFSQLTSPKQPQPLQLQPSTEPHEQPPDASTLWALHKVETLRDFSADLWRPAHRTALADFLRNDDARRLFAFVDFRQPTDAPSAVPVRELFVGPEIPRHLRARECLHLFKLQPLSEKLRQLEGGGHHSGGHHQQQHRGAAPPQSNAVVSAVSELLERLVFSGTVDTTESAHMIASLYDVMASESAASASGASVSAGGGGLQRLLAAAARWPDSVKREFTGHWQKFMASLTEVTHQLRSGSTVLYIPHEPTALAEPEKAAGDKELVQRLESMLIHWTRQIKEVVANKAADSASGGTAPAAAAAAGGGSQQAPDAQQQQQVQAVSAESAGPLAEIEFWRSRTVDLSGIRAQLERPGVRGVQRVLELAKSSYLPPFLKLSDLIQKGSAEAQDNLQFLSGLQQPCEQLARAELRQIPAVLPAILDQVRHIGTASRFYTGPERLSGLLRKVSNEIINRCCAAISLPAIFSGDVVSTVTVIEDSIQCGEAWKELYDAAAASAAWTFDRSHIFAHVDAFVQRCRDLLEICQAQIQFARKAAHGTRREPAVFGGSKGATVAKSMLDIELAFDKLVAQLAALNYNVLDVKATRWHDDFNAFKRGVKDLEVMLRNVINAAFDQSVATVPAGVELLDAFVHLARRETIKRTLDKKTGELYGLYVAELARVKREFDHNRAHPPVAPLRPRSAGAAEWAQALLNRIRRPRAALLEAHSLREFAKEAAEEAAVQYAQLSTGLEDYVRKVYNDWLSGIEGSILKRLDVPLMVVSSAGSGGDGAAGAAEGGSGGVGGGSRYLENNFDGSVRRLFSEAFAWRSLGHEVPPAVAAVCTQEEHYRVVREQVLLVVRDYNNILKALSDEQRKLFNERVASLDEQIRPGLTKLLWTSPNLDAFLGDCRHHAGIVAKMVADFKESFDKIQENCTAIAETLLVNIRKKKVYRQDEFEQRQQSHRAKMRDRLEQKHAEIRQLMQHTYAVFRNDSPDVQREWYRFTQKVDKMVEQALRQSAKRSLQELSKAINGDGKNEVAPLLHVNVVLEQNNRVELQPTLDELSSTVQLVSKELVATIAVVPRLTDVLRGEFLQLPAELLVSASSSSSSSSASNPPAASASAASGAAPLPLSASTAAAVAPPPPPLLSVTSVDGPAAATVLVGSLLSASGSASGATGGGGLLSQNASSSSSSSLGGSAAAGPAAGAASAASGEAEESKHSFYELIYGDEEIVKVFAQITSGLVQHVDQLQRYLADFDKYKHLWDLDKEAYIRRYAKSNRTLEVFEADIVEKQETQKQVEAEETIKHIKFLRLDCSLLKTALIGHCHAWQNKFTGLLAQNASNELRALLELFGEAQKQLKVSPRNVEMLKQTINLLKKMQDEAPAIEARFEPLHRQFKALERFDVQIDEREKAQLELLPQAWQEFRQLLADTEEAIKSKKETFKNKLLQSGEEFGKVVNTFRDEWLKQQPVTSEFSAEKAYAAIDDYRKQLEGLVEKEQKLKEGLAIFAIDPPSYKELSQTAKDLEAIEQLWKLKEEWDGTWRRWKTVPFGSLNTKDMEEDAGQYQKRVAKLGKELKSVQVWQELKEKVDQFKISLPLIMDLKNPCLRPRHWDQLKAELGKAFDQTSSEFTLEALIGLGLDAYQDSIANMSGNASKEMAIEDALRQIDETWREVRLDVLPHNKDGYYRLQPSEEIFQTLEDNQVTLAALKASRFYYAFEEQVEKWEKGLSHVLETIEMIMQVQRGWRYLENIFSGFEDIRKQLPVESATFDGVNSRWKNIMEALAKDNRAFAGTHREGLLEMLVDMNGKLERIQKSLDQYLETKRTIFPRFYFLSNDDLLEVLGQSKEPQAVQGHLSKCFENIKRLELSAQPGAAAKKRGAAVDALGMHSAEGEYVPFETKVAAEGPVEIWLGHMESAMRVTLRRELQKGLVGLKKLKKERWIGDTVGQLVICCSQIQWTADTTKALEDIERGNKTALRELRRKQGANLKRLSDLVRTPLTPVNRLKVVALLTIEVHLRDVLERMIKSNIGNDRDFDWRRQLRFYWERDPGSGLQQGGETMLIRQTNSQFEYGYEYIGNTGRLVVTTLTERCYLTLTTALSLKRGALPQGPAGTGKTESVKDLAKAMGKYTLIFNCSDGLDFQSLGRSFSGLAQTGAWSCFDEFNRIDVEVLSVVAQQVSSILTAIAEERRRFFFEGTEIKLNPTCGIFITMNPGYAGRSELPDNLKSLFRPVSMMVPDFAQIAEIMLYSEGFSTAKFLSKKIVTLYDLAAQQLSKQSHYDFTLRAIKSVLVTSGSLKRHDPQMPEDLLLLRALRDMNLPKFVGDDTALFLGILSDLFPGAEPPEVSYGALQTAIDDELVRHKLQAKPELLRKVLEFYETKQTRHGVMIVGLTGSGKSTVWRTLQGALSRLKEQGVAGYNLVKTFVLNPKAVTGDELYGGYDPSTREWHDGILAVIMRQAVTDPKPDEKWIVFDGPVDTVWIESLNSVLDDSKVLTLTNGERIYLTPQVSLVFEVPDLMEASPATVSRCGMIYLSQDTVGWRAFAESWLARRQEREQAEWLRKLFEKHVQKLLDFKRLRCEELFAVDDLHAVQSLCNLFDSLATADNGCSPHDADYYERMTELWFLFSAIWSIGGSLDDESRKVFDMYLRDLEGQFPHKDTVFEYYVDPAKRGWTLWEEKIPQAWRYPTNAPFHKILVPTVDTVRHAFLCHALIKAGKHVLLVGNVGTGKSAIVQSVLGQYHNETWTTLTVNFSAATTSKAVQEMIEEKVEKRTKGVYVPVGGKRMISFIDDFNIVKKDRYGTQPALELVRQWIDYGSWYDRTTATPKTIKEMQLVCAMGPPGGGRSQISPRLQGQFNVISIAFPSEDQLKRIYGTLINQKLQEFEEDLKPLGDQLTQATIELYEAVSRSLLPTRTKSHYIFNLRDMSKVFQGLLLAHPDAIDSSDALIKLWVHECFRVFYDRLVDERDQLWFRTAISERAASVFGVSWYKLYREALTPFPFGDFLDEAHGEVGRYRELPVADNMDKLRTWMAEQLDEYNMESGVVPLDTVFFKYAIEHVCRIVRIIRQPRGNALLVGVGGSGRSSLARFATYLAGYKVFTLEMKKNFRLQDFRDRLKELYRLAGVENKTVVFLFSDTQILNEAFLEDVCNIMSRGEVPNLFQTDELAQIRDAIRAEAAAAVAAGGGGNKQQQQQEKASSDAWYTTFIERSWDNIHVVLSMSPVGESFRNRTRMFPAVINNTTIDWFHRWPEDALKEVALKYIEGIEFSGENAAELRSIIADICVIVHTSAIEMAGKMAVEQKREFTVTPTNFLQLVQSYLNLFRDKKKALKDSSDKLSNGLAKLDDTREKVSEMSKTLEESKKLVAKLQKDCEEFLMKMVERRQEANDKAKLVAATSEKLAIEEAEIKQIAATAMQELDAAVPALNEAKQALQALNKKDLSEVKAYTSPPPLVEKVMGAVMILRKAEPTWSEAKRHLSDANFLKELIEYQIEKVTDSMLKKVEKYCADPDFQQAKVIKVSTAAASLCVWVRAMEKYAHIFRDVAPKQQAAAEATAALESKQRALADAKQALKQAEEVVAVIKAEYDEIMARKEKLRLEAEDTAIKLDRAEKLVSGLAGERVRWEKSVKDYQLAIANLPGDCVLAAAYLSYCGPFSGDYRERLLQGVWLAKVKQLNVPCSPDFSFVSFMAPAVEVREWNTQGLPNDTFSCENGVLVTRTKLWALCIDPQNQANKWIRQMEGKNLKVITLQQSDFMRTLENAMHFGQPVLLQDIEETLDPALDPILNKAIVKVGNRMMIKLEEGKEVEYNDQFRFYITSKAKNPTFAPEISTKTTIVNFCVTETGLEAQLLGHVVQHERSELEQQKSELVTNISRGKRTLTELEDTILHLLNTAQGSLLDDEQLVNALQSSKETAENVKKSLAIAEHTEAKIDLARQAFSPCSVRASCLFFVLNDLSKVDTMYQFSLDFYLELFTQSIERSVRSDDLQDRIKSLNDYHTHSVYKSVCRGLFEKHKLLFAFQMCIRVMESEKRINKEEYGFFLRGGQVFSKESQMLNPCPDWLPEQCWDNVTVLDHLPSFRNIASSFEQNVRDWKEWYFQPEPETCPLPGEWENKCNELQHMILVRCFRPDRVVSAVTTFIGNNLDPKYVDPPPFDLASTFDISTPQTPLLFVLSPGVDPQHHIDQLAEEHEMQSKLRTLALGQGQAQTAARLIDEGIREGLWIYLANCHLMISWLDKLEQIVAEIPSRKPHADFRLWLSSSPTPKFPASILQCSIKITTEPPRGLKQNLYRLYSSISDERFNRSRVPHKYKKLLFALCFFHSLLLERKKFLSLGYSNLAYDFSDSDFQVSETLLNTYLDEYDETPWDALRYLVSELNYGGRVTDKWDRRLLSVYIRHLFSPEALSQTNFRLSSLSTYFVPDDGPLQTYKDYVASLPLTDKPEAFGQHANADIASQIQDANGMLDTLMLLQPQIITQVGETREQKVLRMCDELSRHVPDDINFNAAAMEAGPLKTVLSQEVERYNKLLGVIRRSLGDLQKGLKGLIVMTPDMDEIFARLYDGRVPQQWQKAYYSLKPLAPWVLDLVQRIEQFRGWAESGAPQTFNLGMFTFPTGFLTALLQISARKNQVPVDTLGWDFKVMHDSELMELKGQPDEGAYISGICLEGGRWDKTNNCLSEPNPMELYAPVPVIWFRPVEVKNKTGKVNGKEAYVCPLYIYPVRVATRERPSFIVPVELDPGNVKPEHWVKRATALLLSTE